MGRRGSRGTEVECGPLGHRLVIENTPAEPQATRANRLHC